MSKLKGLEAARKLYQKWDAGIEDFVEDELFHDVLDRAIAAERQSGEGRDSKFIADLQALANGLDQAADDEDEIMGDGTKDAEQMRKHAALINEAIAALRAGPLGTFAEGIEAAARSLAHFIGQ